MRTLLMPENVWRRQAMSSKVYQRTGTRKQNNLYHVLREALCDGCGRAQGRYATKDGWLCARCYHNGSPGSAAPVASPVLVADRRGA